MNRRNFWMGTMFEAFGNPNTYIVYGDVGRRIILYIGCLLPRKSLDLLLRRGLRRPNFLFKSVPPKTHQEG